MVELYLSLGSNLGDRKANLDEAIRLLNERLGQCEAVSSYLETEPWGFECQEKFLNAAVRYGVNVPRGMSMEEFGLEVLKVCKDIEAEMGRRDAPEYDSEGRRVYHSRIIDIDILMIGEAVIRTQQLTVPHPLMEQREFVMVPLREVMRNTSLGRDSSPCFAGLRMTETY